MNLVLKKRGLLWWGETLFPCTWGQGGIRKNKKEGDGATPIGTFPFRRVFYREDRLERPKTCLPLSPIIPKDGWCDDVEDLAYNQYIQKPYKGRHENLWREDHLYDIILVVGHNDDPIVKGEGSCIFIHLRRPKATPTDGCVALDKADLLQVLASGTPQSCLIVEE